MELLQGKTPRTASEQPLQAIESVDLQRGGFLAIWRDDPRKQPGLPDFILSGEEEGREDLLAWASSFLQVLNPFTAYCRVIDFALAQTWIKRSMSAQLAGPKQAFAGLVLAELACRHGTGLLDSLTPFSGAKTFSFAAARAHALGFLPSQLQGLFRDWSYLAELDASKQDKNLASQLQFIWTILAWLDDEGSLAEDANNELRDANRIHQALAQVFRGEAPEPAVIKSLCDGIPNAEQALNTQGETRERRVRAFIAVLESVDRTEDREPRLSFVLGFLAANIAPGTLDHIGLLDPVRHVLPSALLWYGLLAGASANSSVGVSFRGLGARILREILRHEDPFDPPRADISISDLRVVSRSQNWRKTLRTNSGATVALELLPGVVTYVAIGEPNGKQERQAKLFDPATAHPRDNYGRVRDRLADLLQLMAQVQAELQSLLGPDEQGHRNRSERRRSKGQKQPRSK